jgi:hypothetical protein
MTVCLRLYLYSLFIGRHLDIIEKFYIYQETKNNNQINDKHKVIYNKIFETILENRKES